MQRRGAGACVRMQCMGSGQAILANADARALMANARWPTQPSEGQHMLLHIGVLQCCSRAGSDHIRPS